MDCVFEHAAAVPTALVDEVIGTTGAILGRQTRLRGRPKRGAARDEQALRWPLERTDIHPHPHAARRRDRPGIQLPLGDVREAVAKALAAAQGRNLVVLGANVVGQCLREGLVEEIPIHLLPVLIGDGVRLFGEPVLTHLEAPTSRPRVRW
jgi:dihydrofolate reductase